MTIALQASSGFTVHDSTNATTTIFTPTNAAANGNLAVSCFGSAGTPTTMSTCTGGGVASWTKVKEIGNGAGFVSLWAGIADGTGGAITGTWDVKNQVKGVQFAAFSGVAASSFVDGTPQSATGSSTSYSTGTTGTTTDAGDLIVGGVGHASTSVVSSGPTNSFANFATPLTGSGDPFCAYLIPGSTGTFTTTWTATSRAWCGVIGAFLPAVTDTLMGQACL